MGLKIQTIARTSPLFQAVLELAKGNAKTLGFLPKGAFEDLADKGYVLGAVFDGKNLAGYLLYRKTRSEISITHLCVDDLCRREGIARTLVDHLKDATKDAFGIGLWCRRDYAASKVWGKLGFYAIDEREGRGKDRSVLEHWWFDHNHQTLFTYALKGKREREIPVVIDACVFFSLLDESDANHHEAAALFADWLSGIIDVYVTKEIYRDIQRSQDETRRKKERSHAKGMLLPPGDLNVNGLNTELKSTFPDITKESDLSDLHHLAYAISYGVHYFVTWDKILLRSSAAFEERFCLKILNPTELITTIDELVRESEYSPARISGTYELLREKVKGEDENQIIQRFLCDREGESKASFSILIRDLLAKPQNADLIRFLSIRRGPVGLLGCDYHQQGSMEIRLIRPADRSDAPTVFRSLLGFSIRLATEKNIPLIQISEERNRRDLADAMCEAGFINLDDRWFKIVVNKLASLREIEIFLRECGLFGTPASSCFMDDLLQKIGTSLKNTDFISLSEIEHVLFPGKLAGAGIPSFIVPIWPFWAKQLFDEGLADQELFGAPLDLALSRENVYYRSRRSGGGLTAPGRILWYVSGHGNYHDKQSIRACSRLVEIAVDDARSLFRRFKRLGIFEWKDINDIAEKDKDRRIMALRFDDTELFEKPLMMNGLQTKLEEYGCTANLQSPRKIPQACFEDIYETCKGIR